MMRGVGGEGDLPADWSAGAGQKRRMRARPLKSVVISSCPFPACLPVRLTAATAAVWQDGGTEQHRACF